MHPRQLAPVASVRRWQIWTLRPPVREYILAVLALDAAATVAALDADRGNLTHLGTFLVLLGGGVLVVEAARRVPEVIGTVRKDLHGVWFLPIAIVCPPAFAFLAPILLGTYRLVRVRRAFPYRRVFSDATVSLAWGAASVVFHAAPAPIAGPRPGQHALTWAGLAAGCGILAWLINNGLVLTAIRLATPEVPLRQAFGGRTGLVADVIELSLAVTAALIVAIDPVLIALALPLVVFCQRSTMTAQLVSQTRVDVKTGLLTAVIWRYEVDVEARGHQPLTVLLAEVDDFSSIGKLAGPVAADQVLWKIAANVTGTLPEGALAGRMPEAKFAIVLRRVTEDQARRIGELIRDHVGGHSVDVEHDGHLDFVFLPTVSVGIAGPAGRRRSVTELIAAADAALAEAAAAGGNRIRIAASPPGVHRDPDTGVSQAAAG
jgi:diguanylate cyclase (GGDEF)-like protein